MARGCGDLRVDVAALSGLCGLTGLERGSYHRFISTSSMHTETVQEAVGDAPLRKAAGKGYYRVRGGALALCCLSVLLVAASLEPRACGYGTHTQLDLPACSFRVRTGWPCPSCGLTTSVSAMTHGRVGLAWRAQPFGIAIAVWLAMLTVVGVIESVRARPVIERLRPRLWWAWAGLAGLFAGWFIVLGVGRLNGTLPTH